MSDSGIESTGPTNTAEAAGNKPDHGHTGLIIAIVALAVVVVGLVIWMIIQANANAAPPTPEPTTTSSTATDTPTTPPPVANPTTCTVAELTVSLGTSNGGAGSTEVPLIFENSGTKDCILEGFPGVSFVGDDNGTQLGAPAAEDKNSVIKIYTLAPGDSVQTPLTITDAGNIEGCTVVQPDGLRVYPPHSFDAVFVPTTDFKACSEPTVIVMTVQAAQQN